MKKKKYTPHILHLARKEESSNLIDVRKIAARVHSTQLEYLKEDVSDLNT